ncbi:TonB-dependent receptor domain-containing protein [Vibrio splendidus]|uniref:TonB-dependent receptor domain-containing protein n=1 Tax=Vibrio splendidus TaxID=29497 RepID=UPI000C85A646|nr:TonB-dependent receptor [Vibrio splendidus]PMI83438.1 ligand-gated channel [Vibrio splendidus]PMK13117.1 ligand-gated channel [Vibrio splendidus]PMK56721.1 ligand-gated channel [Vibrio splendidus]
MNKSLLAVAIASLLSPISNLHAQEASTDETMVVTANRFEQDVKDVISPITIVTKEELELSQVKSLPEALRNLPGVQVNSVGFGQYSSVYVRGNSSRHLLVLINGVRIGSSTAGEANFSNIPLTGVERIEFIRGARAALYGSDAISGVINIVTDYQQGENVKEVRGGMGSHGYYEAGVNVAGGLSESTWGKVSVSIDGDSGAVSARSSTDTTPFEDDKDGYDKASVVAELGHQINESLQVSLQGFYHQGKSEYDKTAWDSNFVNVEHPNAESESTLYNIAGKAKYIQGDYLSELTIALNADKGLDSNDMEDDSRFESERNIATWLHSYQISEQFSLGGGLEWSKEKVSTTEGTYIKESRDNEAVFVTANYIVDALSTEASVRTDDNDSYGRSNTWQLGAGYALTSSLQISANVGTGFKAPTFNDLYYPDAGNPNLKPEESFGYELGVSGYHETFEWQVTGYKSEIDQLIAWAPVDPNNTAGDWIPSNVNKAKMDGIESSVTFYLDNVSNTFGYDYVDARDASTKKQLIRRSKHVGRWNLGYELSKWKFDATALYRGKSYEDADNTKELEAYTLVDFAAAYTFSEKLTVRGRIHNAFDEEYTTQETYNTMGRSYYLNATYQF